MGKSFVISLFIILISGSLKAQEQESADSALFELPALHVILEAALKHSPLLQQKAIYMESAELQSKIDRGKWMDNIYFDGSANYGMLDQITLKEIGSESSSTTGFLSTNKQLRYYGGLTIKMPFSVISSRRSENKLREMESKVAGLEYQQVKEDVKQLIITEYYQLSYLIESMMTYYSIYQTLQISYMKAEKDLRSELISLSDFASIASNTGKSKDEYSKARNSCYAQYYRLQELAGINLKAIDGH